MNKIINFNKWLKRKDLATNTIKNYCQAAHLYGKKPLTTGKVREYVRDNLKRYEPSSLYTNIRALMIYARYQKIRINWEKVNRLVPKQQAKYFSTLTEEEIVRIKETRFETNDWVFERNNLIIDLFFYTGLRVSELVQAKFSDLTKNGENSCLKTLGKGNKIRQVFIPNFLLPKLTNPYSKEYLFTNLYGRPLSRVWVGQFIQQRTIKAGINKVVSPHTFRRTFATLLDKKGTRLTTIQKLLGHTRITTTANYIHNSSEELYEDYSKLWKERKIKEPNINHYAN